MSLPDFSEFLDSVDYDKLQKTIADSIGSRIIFTGKMSKENFEAMLSEMMYQSIGASKEVFISYLQEYHEWLQKQL